MSLPDPIPDNPQRWDGWRSYNSGNLYDRLCLSFEENPNESQIEDHTRRLLVWWQKKLPLKNQPSNPIAQLLRQALDEAPMMLSEARTVLLDQRQRAVHDTALREVVVQRAMAEFRKLVVFSVFSGGLAHDAEARLRGAAQDMGLREDEAVGVIDEELAKVGAVRLAPPPPPPPPPPPVPVAPPPPPPPVATQPTAANSPVESEPPRARESAQRSPEDEFRRILRMSRITVDGGEMTDDQRDAMCNLGESLGLTGGQAEDLIDEYLDEVDSGPSTPLKPAPKPVAKPVAKPAPKPTAVQPRPSTPVPAQTPRPAAPAQQPAAKPPQPAAATPGRPLSTASRINTSPLARAKEREQYPNFSNTLGMDMRLVASGAFFMGSSAKDAPPNEQPVTPVTLSCYYMSRFPVTNLQYEAFDPSHVSKRAPWANDKHPVVFVTSSEAEQFCIWLSKKEGKRYRLPTEAEWEFAARGMDGRVYPWGERLDGGWYANFADKRSTLPWRDPNIDDGFAETSPVGSYPKGASPFGMEDMAGNVFEWCHDFLAPYTGKELQNPRGPTSGSQRVFRGGSWKSRAASLRSTARAFHSPEYMTHDLGFRIVCAVA